MRGPVGGESCASALEEIQRAGARRFEAFGRVMAALGGDAELLESCRDLTWWRGADHSWHIEWREGPYATEVAQVLAERAGGPGVLAGPVGQGTPCSAVVEVIGVSFLLRAVDPLGRRPRTRLSPWRLAEALDTTRRGPSPRPWEQLLGG
ncbi:hypothetical protein ACFOWE_13585 [Planomonospora corallina]|uniref:Uncharacterized protein n=1 Tax=Planomonospora corallina TaxID=1806052 RepID=A0ABV8I549_9ACTN